MEHCCSVEGHSYELSCFWDLWFSLDSGWHERRFSSWARCSLVMFVVVIPPPLPTPLDCWTVELALEMVLFRTVAVDSVVWLEQFIHFSLPTHALFTVHNVDEMMADDRGWLRHASSGGLM